MESETFKPFQRPMEQQEPERQSHISQEKTLIFLEENAHTQPFQANSREPSDEAHSRMLSEVAQMTVQSFHSSQEAMSVALEVIGRFLDCQTLFIGRVKGAEAGKADARDVNQHTLRIMEVRNKGTTLPAIGSEGALNRTYCQTIWRTQEPLVIEDSTCQPFYQRLAATREYNIGSYVGVPLIYSDGRVYGTLCAQDPQPHLLSEHPESLELMQIVARLLISVIEREELMQQLSEAEQAQAELARQEQQARAEADQRVHELEAIFEAMGDGLFVYDSQGHMLMNAAAHQLLPMAFTQGDIHKFFEEQQGKEPLVLGEDSQPLTIESLPISRVLQGEHLIGPKAVNIQRANAQGETRYLNISGMPIYDQQQHINGAVLVFRDITERYLLEQNTRELNYRFNEFLSIASHELKGPLTTIQGNIQFAQRTLNTLQSSQLQEHEIVAGLEKLQRYLERAAHQVHVQDRLASDLIDVSRIRAGKLELRMQPCDLGQIVRDTVEDQCQATADRVINLDMPTRCMAISGDPDRLGQVVRNYLTNALKYSAPTKPIGVSVTTDGIAIQVAVSDQGTGLTPEEQQRVWERFYRAKDVRVLSGHGIGLGLGLHICKTIVERHGGSVGLRSTPGEGSCFWFMLPLGEQMQATRA